MATFDNHANLAASTVATAPSPATSGTSLSVQSGDGANFPAAPFNCTVWPVGSDSTLANAEIIRVTSKGTGDNWTIVRAQEGTTARTILTGDQIGNTVSKKVITDLETAVNAALTNVNFSAGTTSNNLSAFTFSNSNGVSFGLNASTITASIATTYAGTGFTTTTVGGAVIAATHDTNGLKLAVPSFLTTADLSANSSKYAATGLTTTTAAGAVVAGTNDTNGLKLGVPAFLTTAMQSNAATISNVNISAGSTSTNASAFTFSNGNNVTFGIGTGASAGVITASVVPPSGAAINISAGTTSTNAGAFTFSNSNNFSFGIGTGASAGVVTGSYTVPTITSWTVSDAATSATVGRLAFTNSNGLTLSLSTSNNGNHTVIGSYTVPTVTNSSWTVSDSATSATVGRLAFVNSNGVSFGLSTSNNGQQTITATVQTNYLTTAALSSQTLAFSLSGNTATTNSSQISNGAFALAGGNNVTLQQSNNTISISVGNYITTAALSQNTSNYAGINSAITGGSLTVNTSGVSVRLSAIEGVGVSNTGNTAGNVGFSTGIDYCIAASGLLTMSQSTAAGAATGWIQHPAWLTTADLSQNSSKYAGINGAITGGSITVNTSGVSVNLPAYLTTAAQSTQTLAFTLGGNVATTNSSQAANGGFILAGGNNITIQQSNNSISISAGNAAPSPVNFSAGTTSNNLGSVVFSNANGVSFGLNGSTITASAAGGAGGVAISNSQTLFSTGTVAFSEGGGAITIASSAGGQSLMFSVPQTSSLVGVGGISISTNGSTISVSEVNIVHFEPIPLLQSGSTTWAPGAGTWHFAPFYLPAPISGGRLNLMVAHGSTASVLRASSTNYASNTTGTGSTNFTYERRAALYSLGAGTNSTRLESFWSNNFSLSINYSQQVGFTAASSIVISEGATMSMIKSIDASGNYTTTTFGASTTLSSSSTAAATNNLTTNLSSMRNVLSSQMMIPIGFNTTINPGNYWLGVMWNTGSTTATTGGAFVTNNVLSVVNQYGIYGNSNTAARVWGQTAASSGSSPFPGVGFYSATSASPPSTIAFSDIRTFANQVLPYFNLVNSTI